MKLLMTIKATANNKQRARVWVESKEIAAYGFTRGTRVDVAINTTDISVNIIPAGERKVAGRTKGGTDISILDICMPQEQREAIRKGAARFDVYIEHGRIRIQPQQIEA